MKKEIIKDQFFLSQKSTDATKDDLYIVDELKETLLLSDNCLGLAANMIGYLKRILVARGVNEIIVMINPEIIETKGKPYETEESCLSLTGTRITKRYPMIKVKYKDEHMKTKIRRFHDLTAQIIQHEMDHFEGILI